MTVIFSASELQEITQWYNEAVAAGNRSAMYLGIAGLLQQKLQGASATDQAMLNQDILWLQGASQANLGNGVYATLIRTYTQAQAELRMGGDISDTLMQTASNAVGDNLYTTIQTLNGGIPDLATIAGDDAKAVGTKIFQPSIPDDSASKRNAGWSGTVLFSMLGSDQTSRLVANGSAVQTLDDARNVLFAMYSMGKALQSAFSTGESEAVQYFMSMIGESSAGSLLTDLSIGFNTLSSSGAVSVDNFFSMAAAFFKNGSLAYVASEFAEIDLNNLLDLMRSSVSGAVTTGTSDASFTSNAKTFFDSVSSSLTTWGVSLPDVKTLLADALNPSSVYDADRNALSVLSPIVVTGMSLAGRNVSLWQPGMTSGLTSNYLSARADMLKLELQYDAANDSVGSVIHGTPLSSQTYYDRSVSASPLYTVLGTAGLLTDITMFGGTGPETLQGGDGNDRLFGGSGPDTMDGGAGNNTLEGGSGFDTYIISGDSKGADSILDTDGNGQIEWKSGGNTLILTGGDEQTGTSVWKSADGSITYFEDIAADGSTELEITSKNKIAYIDNFTNGELGITLNVGSTTTVGSSNLSQLRDGGIAGDTISGEAAHVYKNDLAGATVDSIYGADSSGNSYGNQIDGDGNASYIYAGNGANSVFLGDFDHHATDPLVTPLAATLQGGSGNQNLIGVGNGTETITGGAVGVDTSAVTDIDGGGATALLVGGGQNSVIFGGTGADTLVASSVSATSPSGFNPYTIELAGLSFWGDAYSSKVDGNGTPYQSSSLPNLSWSAPSADNAQIEVSLYQSDDTYGTPFGLLGSSLDSGTEDGSSTLPGSVLIGGTGDDWLIGNRGDDTIVGGDSAQGKNAVLVGGAGADVIYGGGGTEIIYADMSPGAVSNWASLDPNNADTIYGGTGTEFIYGSGGKDVIYGGSGIDAIHVGNGGGYIDTGSGNSSVYGGSGNDTIVADGASNYIQAGGGNAYIEAARGNSTIITGAGDDTIQAAGGNALITEGSGHTTLVAGTSTGSDTLQPNSGGTTLQLIDGLTESTLIVRDVNGDLVLSDPGFDTQITVSGYFNANTGVSLQFADGTTWGAPEILQAAIRPRSDGGNDTLVGSDGTDNIAAGYGDTSIVGTSGNNTLTGGAGDDTIQGGSGADTIEGGSGTTRILGGTGTETYMFNVGDGSDTINASVASAGNDTLRFGAGINASDLTYTYDSVSNNLLIQVGPASNTTITVANFLAAPLDQHQITTLAFADGSTLSPLQVIQQAVAIDGTTGNNSLIGTSGMDYFDGKSGNDTVVGNGGNDTFVFNAGYGHLEINETYVAGQQPVLQLGTGITTSTLHVTTDGNSLKLVDGTSGDQITVDGMFSSNTSGVAAVQLADGTTLTRAQLILMEMTGTTGNDTLAGTSGADLLDGMGGSDSVIGGGGNDTFVFNAGYGHLDISEHYNGGQQPVLQLGTGITLSTLHVTSDNTNLFMTDGVSGDQITVDSMWIGRNEGYGVVAVQLDDGTTLTAAQLLQMELTGGTSGSDTIYGRSGADLIDGKGGNDFVSDYGASDTLVFDAGYGHLEIDEKNFNSSQQSVLQLGAGIMASTLRVTSNGTDLLLSDGVIGDQVTLDKMWSKSSSGYGVAAVQLINGTTLTVAQLFQMELTGGTSGNDTIYGTSGADLIDGKGGSDLEIGEGGNDTFVFNQAYGHLEIKNSIGTNSHPILQLGAGITLANLHVSQDAIGGDLYLSDGTAGDQVQLVNMLSQPGYWGVSTVELADGTTLTLAQLEQMEFNGTIGNDSIYGTTGAESLDGNGGNDYINGHGGNDTFAFNRGYGLLDIVETYTVGQQPVLQLGAGITASELHVTTDGTGTALYLTDGTSGDAITLAGMWASSTQGVAVVKLSDGTTLTRSQLIQMEMTGTTGDDAIYGTSAADLIDGKGGSDVEYGTIFGGPGNDTFVFDKGYGNLTINQTYITGEQSVLQLGPGITASSFRVMERNNINNDDLVLTDGAVGDEIDMVNMNGVWVGGGQMNGVQQVKFADGTSFTWSQLQSMAGAFIYGSTGSDPDLGNDSDTRNGDYIDGKGGGDTVYASGGNDTFVFNAGYGMFTINATQYGYEDDPVLLLGGGIRATSLYATSTYNSYSGSKSIYITDGISGDKITLNNMGDLSSGDESPILEFDDGTSMTMAQLLWAGAPKGTTGNDTIVGTWGNELIDAKGGDDSVVGNGGSDTFIFDSGYGQLDINESYLIGQTPVLQLGAGITASALGVTTNGTDIYLTDGISGDRLTLDGMGSSTSGVAEVMLADGTTLTSAQLIQIELSGGSSGSDTLSGTSDDDLIDGKGGSDFEIGNGGNDTFVFNSGYGQLEINESYLSEETPVLELGTGITASALRVTSDGTNLYLTDGVNGDRITLDGMWNYSMFGVAQVMLADGTMLTPAQLAQMELSGGTSGNDTLYGTYDDDLIDGKGGNDSVIGNGGYDTFVFNAGYGDLEINESFDTDAEQPVLQLGVGISASTLHVMQSGNNLVMTDGVTGDQITLDKMWSSSTDGYGVTAVQLADGTTLTAAQLLQMASQITGTTGNDTMQGTSGAELVDGMGGNDSVVGGGGNDTFVFNAGYGHLEINETHTSSEHPVLQLGDGITVSALHVTETNNNLLLTDGVSGDQVTLDTMWSSTTHGVATVQLADGTTLTRSQLIQMEMTGTTGNDTLQGTSGADLLDGNGGNDSVVGGGGNDTFVFNTGYGDLEINETHTSSQHPVLQLGDGITTSALHVTETGNNLLLTDGISGDQVTLDTMWSSTTHGVATVQLADGTTLTRSQLIQMEMIGTTGNDTLQGTSGADLLDGDGGNDSVVGGGGNDTFVFNTGYGDLEINESFTSSQHPVLQLGAGITASTLHVVKSGNNLLLTDGISGDQVTLDSMSSSSTHGVATVQLAGGTTLTRSQLIQMETIGTTGNDTLQGTAAAELIDGKGGNDSVVGGGGNDTFVFNTGYGQLVINETHTSTQTPILQLGAGITTSTLNVTKSGSNLVLTDGVTGDQVTLNNMSSSSTSGVATVKLADGTTLTRSQLIQRETAAAVKTPSVPLATSDNATLLQINPLIHAIASYTGNSGGGGMSSVVIPPATSDVMLHAAA